MVVEFNTTSTELRVGTSTELDASLIENIALDDEESEDENVTNTNAESTGKKKKKKKKKSKAKKAESVVITPPISRLLGGSTDYFTKYGQTNPPTIPVR